MSKGDGRRRRGPNVSQDQYDRNFEEIFGINGSVIWDPQEDEGHEHKKQVQDQPTCKGGSRGTTESPTPCDENNDREDSRHSGGEAQEFSDSGSPQ